MASPNHVDDVHSELDVQDVPPESPQTPSSFVEKNLQRQLKNRHVAMISIGGVIGTGLFLGTAMSLANGGPVGLLLGYLIMGSICFSVMISLGEMIALLPIPGGHIALARHFVGRSLSFAMGWNYWYGIVFALPTELSAAAILFQYWDKSLTPAIWIAVTLFVTFCLNVFGAKYYGEGEFWFAFIKVITISGLIILGIVLVFGGGPDHERIGFRYWINPGPFNQYLGIPGPKGRFLAFWSVLIQAAFSFTGTEIVAIAAGEAKNPRRNIPRSIRRVYYRILLFYIGGTAIIGLLVPYNDPRLTQATGTAVSSPFVIATQKAGIDTLPSIVNACLLTSAWSAASSQLYTSSRALYGLASARNAPRFFLKLTGYGLPWTSMIFCACFGLFAFMAVGESAGKVFHWLSDTTANAGLISWFGICVTYLRFYAGMKAQGRNRKDLPYYTNFQPYAAWYALVAIVLITFFSGYQVFLRREWSVTDLLTTYLPLVLFPILFFSSKWWYKEKLVTVHQMDFDAYVAKDEEPDEPLPKNMFLRFVVRLWRFLM